MVDKHWYLRVHMQQDISAVLLPVMVLVVREV